MVSALMLGGPSTLTRIRVGFEQWASDQGCRSIGEMRGTASMAQCENPQNYKRANYLQVMREANRSSPISGH